MNNIELTVKCCKITYFLLLSVHSNDIFYPRFLFFVSETRWGEKSRSSQNDSHRHYRLLLLNCTAPSEFSVSWQWNQSGIFYLYMMRWEEMKGWGENVYLRPTLVMSCQCCKCSLWEHFGTLCKNYGIYSFVDALSKLNGRGVTSTVSW